MFFLHNLGSSFIQRRETSDGPVVQVDARRHPALGVHARYSDRPLYSPITGKEATRKELEADPFFRPGTWSAPPGEIAGILLAKSFQVSFSFRSDAGSGEFNGECSIHQTAVKERDSDGRTETKTEPETIPEIVYQDGNGTTYPLDKGSWDWNERAARGVIVAPSGEPSEVPEPPASPMGRIATAMHLVEITDNKDAEYNTHPDTHETTLHLYNREGMEDWEPPPPDEIPVTLTFNDHVSSGITKRASGWIGIEKTAIYHAKYGFWSLPVTVTANGFTVKGASITAEGAILTPSGEWPVNPMFLFQHYRYDEEEWRAIDEARQRRAESLSKQVETTGFAGGLGLSAWTEVPPDINPKDRPKKITVTASVKPVEFFPSFSKA